MRHQFITTVSLTQREAQSTEPKATGVCHTFAFSDDCRFCYLEPSIADSASYGAVTEHANQYHDIERLTLRPLCHVRVEDVVQGDGHRHEKGKIGARLNRQDVRVVSCRHTLSDSARRTAMGFRDL